MYKILVLGNGFDVACGLPTKYTDFLNFIKYIYPEPKYIGYDGNIPNINPEIKEMVDKPSDRVFDIILRMQGMIVDNIWVNHFLEIENKLPVNDKWMDFEAEMARVIKTIDQHMKSEFMNNPMSARENVRTPFTYPKGLESYNWVYFFTRDGYKNDIKFLLRDTCVKEPFLSPSEVCKQLLRSGHEFTEKGVALQNLDNHFDEKRSYDEIRKGFLEDLNGLKSLLRMYLREFASKVRIDMSKISEPVRDSMKWFCDPRDPASVKHLIINFNYTDTFNEVVKLLEKNYTSPENIQICHIHGKIGASGVGNIVIGIDDGSDKEDVYWGEFEKYYQKIQIAVDGSFYDFVGDMDEYEKDDHEVRIIGHSLAFTDRHPLEKIFRMPRTRIKCYYFKNSSEIIRNATAIIGKDEILSRALGNHSSLVFLNDAPTNDNSECIIIKESGRQH